MHHDSLVYRVCWQNILRYNDTLNEKNGEILATCPKDLIYSNFCLNLCDFNRDVGTGGPEGPWPPHFLAMQNCPFEAQTGRGNVPILGLGPPLFRCFLRPWILMQEPFTH